MLSFFAMCQSMKDNWLNTKLYAVDTWEGDEQAGFYGAEVWESVNKIKKICFGEQDTVFMRMLFNDAVKEFEDETFDLIHIDGLHSYMFVCVFAYMYVCAPNAWCPQSLCTARFFSGCRIFL